jgi:hypothetical protein
MRVSQCCGAPADRLEGDEVIDWELMNMCPRCKEYCSFANDDEDGRPDSGDREFSAGQLAQIDALTKSWAEQDAQEAADEAEWLREHEQGVKHDDN